MKEVFYMTTSILAIHFSMGVSLFHGSMWRDPYVLDIFISQHLWRPSIRTSGLWLIWELQPCSFKGVSLFYVTSCSNFCLESTVLHAQKHLQLSHSFMVNVLIWQFSSSNCSYSWKGNVRNSQKLKYECLVKYYIIWKRFCLKINV